MREVQVIDELPSMGEIGRRAELWRQRHPHAVAAMAFDDERARRAVEGAPVPENPLGIVPTVAAWADPDSGLCLADGPLVIAFDDEESL